jgi:XRE family aerobic/anaerobic benzoate catabolism transcriptional regulator
MAVLETELLPRLAETLRSHRESLGMTVKRLSEKSGVSERFIVSLESGTANVSVLRLADVARALDANLGDLFEYAQPRKTKGLKRRRDGIQTPITLIGLRGAGKSTLGAQVAARLDAPFIELDERIAERAGLAPGEIFELHGPAYYRKLEREEYERLLADLSGPIIATAGSMVTEHATFERILATSLVVWIRASPEDHIARVAAQGDTRPMANSKDAMKELRGILRTRRALYERAHHIIDTSALGLARSIERLFKIAR